MKLGTLRRRAIDDLAQAGIENGRRQADWIMGHVLGLTPAELVIDSERGIPVDQELKIRELIRRRLEGEPVQYIVGWTEFFGLRISVRPGVLIPRPETEVLVEEVLSIVDKPGSRILDVGTGSGCIALAIKSRRPDAAVVGCDVSETAIEVARGNAEELGLEVKFVTGNVERAESLLMWEDGCDVLVSNPPYIPTWEKGTLAPEVRNHEPYEALFAGSDPLRYYRALIDRSRELVADGGALAVEVHADYAVRVAELASAKGLSNVRMRRDLAGLWRVVTAVR